MKILLRSDKDKITFKAIEKYRYGLRKTIISKHLESLIFSFANLKTVRRVLKSLRFECFFCLLLIKKQGLVGRGLITLHKAKGRSFNFSSFSLDCLLDLITKMPSLYAEIEMLQNEPLTCRFLKGKHLLYYIPYRSTDPSPSCVAPCIIVFLVF